MKKNFFYLALAALVTMGMTACSSDDEDEVVQPDPVNLPLPANAEKAVEYILPTAMNAKNSTTGNAEEAPSLKGINFSESGKIVLELLSADGGKRTYVTDNATLNGNVFTMSGNRVKGTITTGVNVLPSRATSTEGMEIDITVTVSVDETVTYSTGGEVVTVTTNRTATGDEVMDRLARTWSVTGAILDLKSKKKNIKAYEEFDSNSQGYFDLRQVREEAIAQDVKLSDDEKAEFERTVKNITITKSNLFIIEYTDHEADVAEWAWNNADKTSIRIVLKDGEMGNKFFNNDTKIAIAFNGNRCNLKMNTDVSDNENNDWEVELTLKLKE